MDGATVVEATDSNHHEGETRARPRIVLADDHRDVLKEMANLLSSDFEVVRAVGDGLSLLESTRELRPDVVISDINMPEMNGIDAGRRILEQGLCGAVILLTVYDEPQLVRRALEAGIGGYVVKVDAGEEIIAAVTSVLGGNVYLSRAVRRRRTG